MGAVPVLGGIWEIVFWPTAHKTPDPPQVHGQDRAASADRARQAAQGSIRRPGTQLLAGGFHLRNTAARIGHSGSGATTLRHYADPVPEVDRRAAAYLAKLTARSAAQTD